MISKSKDVFVAIVAVLAAFVLFARGKEGWRPFAWYGILTHQAGGDWSGVVPATRDVEPPTQVVPPLTCGGGYVAARKKKTKKMKWGRKKKTGCNNK